MNLRQLEAFRATIESGSITGAAELLHISQPSVSRLISDLERSVGFPLFLRVGRGLKATVEARRFYRAVDSMFFGIGRLEELAQTIRTTAGGVVSVGVIASLSQSAVPRAVNDIIAERPDIHVMLSTRNTPAIIDAVRMQQFDLGVVGREPPYDGVETLYHTALPYVCLIPSAHAAARGDKPIDLQSACQTESFVTFGGAYPDDMMGIDKSLSRALQRGSRLSATNMPMAAALVKSTGAWAIVDPFTAEIAQQLGGVTSRTICQTLTYHIAIITRGLDTLSREAGEFSEKLITQLHLA